MPAEKDGWSGAEGVDNISLLPLGLWEMENISPETSPTAAVSSVWRLKLRPSSVLLQLGQLGINSIWLQSQPGPGHCKAMGCKEGFHYWILAPCSELWWKKWTVAKAKKGLVCGLADPFLFGVSAGMKWMVSSLRFFSKKQLLQTAILTQPVLQSWHCNPFLNTFSKTTVTNRVFFPSLLPSQPGPWCQLELSCSYLVTGNPRYASPGALGSLHAKPRDENQWVSCGKNAQKSYQPNNVHFQTCLILRDLPLDLHLDCINFTETPASGSLSSPWEGSAGLAERIQQECGGMSVLAWALQQRAESSKDTLELEFITFFEVSGWNPAPVSPEQTLHNLVLSLWGAAEHQHTKGLCLWRKKRTFLKQNHSVREGSSPTSATYLLKFALPGIRTL